MNFSRIAVLSAGLLAFSGAIRIFTGHQCLTERRVYCSPDMSECHTERDFYWFAARAGECPDIVDTIPRDIPPTPVFKCEDDAGEWYSWAPCDQEPDPINV